MEWQSFLFFLEVGKEQLEATQGVEWKPIVFCVLGSFAVNFLNLIELVRVPPDRRPNFKDIFYWLHFFGMPLLAAIVGWAYVESGQKLNALLALQVGASTPLIIRAFASVIPRELNQARD